jgi:hypothetical protein
MAVGIYILNFLKFKITVQVDGCIYIYIYIFFFLNFLKFEITVQVDGCMYKVVEI